MRAPYYGAYFATATMAGASRIAAIDSGNGPLGAYATYGRGGQLLRVAIVNTEFLSGGGGSTAAVSLSGLSGRDVALRRLTAPNAMVMGGKSPSFGGKSFQDGSCQATGESRIERRNIEEGKINLRIRSSEAVLLDFMSN